eukprot:snap_masked-scaffold_40-processed-gene-2.1-mRNA-1 protein AED:1.00 eAED:1.00 QI:0/0/0/0/1/1/2/0/257
MNIWKNKKNVAREQLLAEFEAFKDKPEEVDTNRILLIHLSLDNKKKKLIQKSFMDTFSENSVFRKSCLSYEEKRSFKFYIVFLVELIISFLLSFLFCSTCCLICRTYKSSFYDTEYNKSFFYGQSLIITDSGLYISSKHNNPYPRNLNECSRSFEDNFDSIPCCFLDLSAYVLMGEVPASYHYQDYLPHSTELSPFILSIGTKKEILYWFAFGNHMVYMSEEIKTLYLDARSKYEQKLHYLYQHYFLLLMCFKGSQS